MKKHGFFIAFFSFVIAFFLWKLILMKSAFLGGDYLVQFYPWSKLYSAAVKNFCLPYWVRMMGSGFPLMAEGQIGGFYPLNIVMFFFLPFNVAYNYSVVLHFVLAGAFTYLYTRKMGACQWGGCIAALVFCFGSAYAGCFYNIGSARTLIWFPLILFLFEKYFEKKEISKLITAGIILGMQLLAGFVQFAFYSIAFYLVYFVYSLILKHNLRYRDAVNFLSFVITAIIVALPQLLLTYQLVSLSSRHEASLGFALWGSFSPLNIMSTCFPYTIFHGTRFYIGVLSIIFFAMASLDSKHDKKIRPIFAMFIISIFLALGLYNPVYTFLLKITHLYFFRNPSKFIFFGVFAASVMSGIGFSKFFAAGFTTVRIKAAKICAVFFIMMLSTFFIARAAMVLFTDDIIGIGKWLVFKCIAGKSYHRYDVSAYIDRVGEFYNQLVIKSSPYDIFVLSSLILCILVLMFCVYLIMMKKRLGLPAKFLVTAVIFIDLYVFSFYGTGFTGNIKSFESLKPTYDIIIGKLETDKDLFRIMPFGLAGDDKDVWFMPNANILNGIDSIAAYTPLVESQYRDALQYLQIVDDSLGVQPPSSDSVIVQKRQLLRLLNVKYIVSRQQIDLDFLEKVSVDNGLFFYEIKDCLPRLFFTRDIARNDIIEEFKERFFITDYRSGLAEAYSVMPCNGYIVFSENHYPGWRVYIDGREAEIVEAKGMVQAVKITEGSHRVTFKFSPKFY